MLGSSRLGQLVGIRVGSYLGRQIALGACRDDDDDDVERRPFRSPLSQLPSAVDLRSWMTRVEEQGSLGSCTSNAVVGALEYLVRRETGRSVDLSRLFVYFNQRLWDDRIREDSGASIASGIRVLHRAGVPTERNWPYDRNLFAVQPPEPVFREAAEYRATDWWSLPVDGDALRACLASGFPVIFGTRVTESFVKTPRNGMCGMPQGALDARHGRHALLLAGYDDARRVFIVRNSWGDDWGDAGYVYMPYDYVLNRQWTSSCWAFRTTTRDNFDPTEHGGTNLSELPHAPPNKAASATTRVAGTVAGVGASTAVRALTGSGLLAGLAGGLFAGLTPGVAKRLQGRDRGAYLGEDRSEAILALLRGQGPPPPAAAAMPWDPAPSATAPAPMAPVAVGADAPSPPPQPPPPVVTPPIVPPSPAGVIPPVVPPSPTGVIPPVVPPSPAGVIPPVVPPSPAGVIPPVVPPVVAPPIGAPPVAGPLSPGGGLAPPHPSPVPIAPTDASPPVASNADFVSKLPAAFATRWREEGGKGGKLGMPISAAVELKEGDRSGRVVRFEGGALLGWSPPRDAPREPPLALFQEQPAVACWEQAGATRAPVGVPLAEVEKTPDGAAQQLVCTRGVILSHPQFGAHAVHSNLFALFEQLGGLAELGYPLSAATVPADPTQPESQSFERGNLHWAPARGGWRD